MPITFEMYFWSELEAQEDLAVLYVPLGLQANGM